MLCYMRRHFPTKRGPVYNAQWLSQAAEALVFPKGWWLVVGLILLVAPTMGFAAITHCPTNRIAPALANCTFALPDFTPELESSDPDAVASVAQSPGVGTEVGLGEHSVLFTVTYTSGFVDTCTALLTVVDLMPPTLTCVPNKNVACIVAWSFDEPTATDACGTNTISVLSTLTNTTCGASSVATRAWQAVDAYGNSATCTQVVAVVDTTPPVIVCPSNLTVECASSWSFGTPAAADNCLGGQLVYDNAVNDLATRLDPGTNEVGNEIILAGPARYLQEFSFEIWSTNLTGSPSLEGANVTVRLRFYANDGPNFNGYPTPGRLLYDSGEFSLGPATSLRSTVVYNEFDLWLFALHPLAAALPNTFTWTAQFSGMGNNDRLGVDLFSPPTIGDSYRDYWLRTNGGWELWANSEVPLNFAAQARASTNQVAITLLSTTTNAHFGSTYVAARAWQAVDACGNLATCTQTVTVVDTTAPLVLTCATNVTLIAGANCMAVVPDLTGQITAADCSAYSVTQTPAVGTELGAGAYALTFSLLDAASNASACVRSLVVAPPAGSETNLSLSEFMAKNTTLGDEDGTFSDWIEIRNAGPCPVNLDGWSLTDNAAQLTKWRFPATNIAAGQYLVVWASDKNRRIPGLPLHTSFKLSDDGEYLGLVRADGSTIAAHYSPTFPPQLSDVSFGLPSDRSTNSFLAWPTPGAANSPGTNFVVSQLTFTPARGWFTNSVSVSVTTPTAGVAIYYTTNGTVPTPSNGYSYSSPLVFTNTTVLRAVGYRTGYAPTLSDGHTYIFPARVADQNGAGFPTNWGFTTNVFNTLVPVPTFYTNSLNILYDAQSSNLFQAGLLGLPTLSIVMHPDEFFGSNGIYANSFRDGSDWERPCSVEYFRPDAVPGFQINCGIRLQGSMSRDPAETPKHKLRLLFKQIYGSAFLVHNLFPDSPVNEFATLSLNGVFQDHWIYSGATATMQRDQWCADTQVEMGGYGKHGTYVNLYINGLFWGMYCISERPDASYAAHYLGGQKADYDAINGPDELSDGSWVAWDQMMAIANAGITNEVAYSLLAQYLDIPTFIDYLLMNFYAANQDWPEGNWRAAGSIQKGIPFHFFAWDSEVSFYGTNWDSTGITAEEPGALYNALRQYPEFRQLFGDHAQRLLFNGGVLTPQRCADRWMRRAQEIDLAVFSESARWGDMGRGVFTKDDWLEQQDFLLTQWFPSRTDILIAQLRNKGLYPALPAPVLNPHGGLVIESLTVTMSAPLGTIYYTTNGSDPRLPGGGVAPDAFAYGGGVILTNSGSLHARAFATNAWSALVEADYQLANVVDLRLRNITRESNGDVHLEFTGVAGSSYTLSVSTDLIEWEVLTTLTPVEDGTFSYIDQAAGDSPVRFYRLASP